jgi:hypothetical protein
MPMFRIPWSRHRTKLKPDEVSGFSLRTHRNIPNSSSRAEPTTSETACGPGVGKPTFTASKGSRLKKLDDRLGTCGLQPRFDVRVNWTPSTNVRLTGRLVSFLQPRRSGKRLRRDCRAPGYSRAAAHIAHERVVRRMGDDASIASGLLCRRNLCHPSRASRRGQGSYHRIGVR